MHRAVFRLAFDTSRRGKFNSYCIQFIFTLCRPMCVVFLGLA